MTINREISQFASFVCVDDATKNIGIATTSTPNVGIGTTNPRAKFEVVGNTKLQSLNVTGVGTVAALSSTDGTITNLTGTGVTYTNGNITNLTGTGVTYTNGTITNLTGTAVTYTNGTITNLTGTSGTITTFDSTTGTITYGTITNLSGTLGTITTFNSTTGIITNVTVSGITSTGSLTVTGSNVYFKQGLDVTGTATVDALTVFPGPSNLSGQTTLYNALTVAGVTTLASSGGITTTGGNLYVGSDLYVARNAKIIGVSTFGNTVVGGATTQLIVTGDARVTGILTIGTSSLTLDGTNNQINVGTGVTIQHTNGVLVGSNTLSSTGLIVNAISASGIATFTNGAVFIGAATSTGTASQPLQVTGGAYVSGSVGIGTTNPGASLHITPTASSIAGLFSGTTSSDMVRITQTGDGNALVVEDDNNPDSTPFVINSLGNVGIGTNTVSLAHKLHVHDSLVQITNSTEGSGVFRGLTLGYDSSLDTQIINSWSKSIELNTSTPGTHVILQPYENAGRNVGIGTTNPTSNLHVVGNANITGVLTATTFSGAVTGIAASATQLVTPRTFEITGDVVASPISFDGTGNVSLAATIQPNSVGLGTDTTGDYVRDITGTANQITVTGGTGEGSTPTLSVPSQFTAPQDVTVTRDLLVSRNLNVSGNITIGGTSATLFTTELKISDPDIVLGFRTDGSGNDVSNDNTANHGGVALASTEGNPLVNLYIAGIDTTPPTYKKIMWFKSGTFSGLGTDAWLINYAVGIGSTQFPTGTRLAAGNVQFTQNDLVVVRNINASGVVTATTFVGNLTNTLTLATSGTGLSGSTTFNNSGASTFTVTSNATNANTASAIVARDASGNFSAGTITASLTGTASSTTNIPNLTGAITSNNTTTSLGSFTSAQLATALTDETGSGANVFATSPTLVTPSLGIATATSLYVSGNLGIGTAIIPADDYKLVVHDGFIQCSNLSEGGGVLKGLILGYDSSLDTQIINSWSKSIELNTSTPGTHVILQPYENAGRNVGIGTTNPTSNLHVVGNANITGVLTATTFVGALTGTATSTTNIPNLTGAITSNNTTTTLGSFTSAQLATALTDETGSGANVFATSPTLVTPILGTPQSGTLSSCTGLPVSTGISGLAANVATFLATPSSANLISALTDETGTGALVFANTPTLVTPILGAATATSLVVSGIVTANSYNVGTAVGISTTITTGITTTAATTIDSFAVATFRSARLQIQITQSTNYQASDILVIHNGTTASFVEYASIATNDYLGTLSVTVSGGNVLTQVAMTSATSATVKVLSQKITV